MVLKGAMAGWTIGRKVGFVNNDRSIVFSILYMSLYERPTLIHARMRAEGVHVVLCIVLSSQKACCRDGSLLSSGREKRIRLPGILARSNLKTFRITRS